MLVAQAALDQHEYDQNGVMNNDFEMRLCIKLYSGNVMSGDGELRKSYSLLRIPYPILICIDGSSRC
jgi:hypothetical protein